MWGMGLVCVEVDTKMGWMLCLFPGSLAESCLGCSAFVAVLLWVLMTLALEQLRALV